MDATTRRPKQSRRTNQREHAACADGSFRGVVCMVADSKRSRGHTTTYTVEDDWGNEWRTNCTDRAERLSRAGLTVTAVTR